jgi:hypothetical protein
MGYIALAILLVLLVCGMLGVVIFVSLVPTGSFPKVAPAV